MRISSFIGKFGVSAVLAMGLAAGALAQTSVQKQFGPRVTNSGETPQPTEQQQPGAQQPQVDVIATHGAWKVQCEVTGKTEQQPDGQKSCGMVQGAKNEKNPKAVLTLVLVKAKQGDKTNFMMRVIAPIGVFLPTGVALEIDGAAVGRVPFTRCMPQICMAFAEASPETLEKMKKGSEANFIIYEAPGVGLPMKMSLEGFSAALGELDKL